MLNIRLAHPADAPDLVRLNAAFNDIAMPVEAVRRNLESADEIVTVAEYGGIIVGFCCAQVHHSFCYPAPVAEVTEMYVDEPFRRRGCAAGMLRHLESHLRAAYNVDELHLLTGTGNLAAQAAYKRAGFCCKNEVFMTKEL